MFQWIKKLHIYAGLLAFSAVFVWGVTGIYAVFLPGPGGYEPPPVSETREIPLPAPGDLDDKALAKHIYDSIDIPLRGGHYNIRRDEDANLAFFVFTASGRRDITYLEERGVVRMDVRQNNVADFLSTMHTAHSRRGPRTLPARMWGYYNEFSTWAFLFMTVSGLYMWLETRPGMRWAQATVGVATVGSLALWLATR